MTVTTDDRKRVVLKDASPGQSFDYSRDSEGRIVLRALQPVPDTIERPRARKRLVKRKDGSMVFVGGEKITDADVKRLLEDFP